MEFFEDLAGKVTSTVNKASKKAEDIADLAKKKLSIKAEEDKLDTLYSRMGKLRYAELRHGEDKSDATEKLISEIDSSVNKIKEIRESIAKAKGLKICDACGAEIGKGDSFCPMCGKNQNK